MVPDPVEIHTDYIPLGQFVKLAGLADTGSESKAKILAGEILVNGEVERRRGRKLYPGDVVALPGNGRYMVTKKG